MSISGDLDDLSVADVLQFVHLGGRSGTLVIERGDERGEVTFHRGRIIAARAPSTRRLGDLLIADGSVSPDVVARAARRQRDEAPRRGLGRILVDLGAISADQLRDAVVRQIEGAVFELVGWRCGRFHFAVDELRVPDEIAVDPGELILEIDLNTQMLLLEAMRIFDERNARVDATEPPAAAPPAGAAARRVRYRVQLLGVAPGLARAVTDRLRGPDRDVVGVSLREAGSAPPGEPAPAVVVDLAAPRLGPDAVAQVRRTRPRALVIGVVDPGGERAAFDAGAMAAVGRDPDLIAASLRAAWRVRRDLADDGAIDAAVQAGFAKLRAVFTELRSGLMSATVSLTLMNAISDAVDRAVMFAVRRQDLVTLGAFGQAVDGRALADATRGLILRVADAGLLAEALRDGRARVAPWGERVPDALARVIGAPASGELAVFPVAGAEREIAVIYADNGASPRAIEQVDVLELAAAHVGIGFENELLRRRISRAGVVAP